MGKELPKLQPGDIENKDAEFWKQYRLALHEQIKEKQRAERLAKTPENIYLKAKEIGVKATGRYFEIQPSQVRYYIRKYEQDNQADSDS